MNSRKKPDKKSLGVSLDLTNVNLSIKDNSSITYAFSDIKCSVALKFNNITYKMYSSNRRSLNEMFFKFLWKSSFVLGESSSAVISSVCLYWERAPLAIFLRLLINYLFYFKFQERLSFVKHRPMIPFNKTRILTLLLTIK